ncbi:alanine racemase [Aquamicrobium sp. NLF2-7]|uniref:alanine racemase n=1 Tax=Aquamicrobium sp. NLF2-7 TaxID=2918753 RepID=UPI001EFB4D17|nr:alanine racemase [Aquamicrobium sp. NLF2-7]MCG8271914.1 alanine racemase [Aquamicrobium sp. NLF2-7]
MNQVPRGYKAVATDPAADAGSVLTIDLGAIRENYRRLKARLGNRKCAGVVKADGYGLGADRVARALMQEGCDTFFVAHVGEGIALRAAIGTGPAIYVLNGLPPGAEADAVAAGLIAVLNSTEQLGAWREAAKAAGHSLPAALQVDSGMSRLGMLPREVEAVAADPKALEGIDLRLVMSHLACADEPHHPANEAQRREFDRLRAMLPDAPASLANSSGIFLGEGYHHQIARPGAALYGINPTPGAENPMLPVIRLQSKVIQTRTVEQGAGIGYGHTATAAGVQCLATISLGYADGWHRCAASAARFNSIELPFIGRVSMDSIILDISTLPEGALRPGDLVDIIDADQTIDDVAGSYGTIAYEVLTSLGHRFHRIYVGA